MPITQSRLYRLACDAHRHAEALEHLQRSIESHHRDSATSTYTITAAREAFATLSAEASATLSLLRDAHMNIEGEMLHYKFTHRNNALKRKNMRRYRERARPEVQWADVVGLSGADDDTSITPALARTPTPATLPTHPTLDDDTKRRVLQEMDLILRETT